MTTRNMKDYIGQALLLLMETTPFAQITVQDIARKAGVNRSTYYRHFASKEAVLEDVLDQMMCRYEETLPGRPYAGLQAHLRAQFAFFADYRRVLLTLYDSGQIHRFLPVLQRHLGAVPALDQASLTEQCRRAYHIGGIFQCYLLWLERRMEDSPEAMAEAAAGILPPDFTPFLLR